MSMRTENLLWDMMCDVARNRFTWRTVCVSSVEEKKVESVDCSQDLLTRPIGPCTSV